MIFLTSRTDRERQLTLDFLNEHQIRYNHIIFNAPYGERILMNDDKPSGLTMALAVCGQRDAAVNLQIKVDESL